MDDVARVPNEASLWEPHRRMDGSIQISVNYRHTNGRLTFDTVSLERYLELFNSEELDFQVVPGKSRPAHNPTPQEARVLIESEAERAKNYADSSWSPAIDQALKEPVPKEEIVEDFNPQAARRELRATYERAIRDLSGNPDWDALGPRERKKALSTELSLAPWKVSSFLQQSPDLGDLLEEEKTIPVEPRPLPYARVVSVSAASSAFSGMREVRTRMSRNEKIGILKTLADRLKQEKKIVTKGLLVSEATKKNGPLEGKTTSGSLKVFIYTLAGNEETAIGL